MERPITSLSGELPDQIIKETGAPSLPPNPAAAAALKVDSLSY